MKLFWKKKSSKLTLDEITIEIKNFQNEKVKSVLKEIGINALDEYGRTALIWASFAENIDLITWLFENKAEVNHQDVNGYCALHFAAQERKTESTKYLLNQNAETELKDKHLNTPLWTAVMSARNNFSVVELLLKNGANLDNLNKVEKTPREMAETIFGLEFEDLKRKLNIK